MEKMRSTDTWYEMHRQIDSCDGPKFGGDVWALVQEDGLRPHDMKTILEYEVMPLRAEVDHR